MVGQRKASVQKPWRGKLPMTLALSVWLTGCSTSTALCDAFGPSKRATIAVPPDTPVEKVFICVDQASINSPDRARYADTGHAVRDVHAGVLETQQYSASNVAGFRLRADVSQQTPATLTLSLRGAGAYCADLGVDKEMDRLKTEIASCLQR